MCEISQKSKHNKLNNREQSFLNRFDVNQRIKKQIRDAASV